MINKKSEFTIFIIAVSVVILLWFLNAYLLYCRTDKSEIGEMFGAVNALFTGLAFAGVIYTIYIQREDLKLTREELEGQKLQLQAQNETMNIQRFENTFFQLLGLHNDIVNSIKYHDTIDKKVYSGRDCFSFFRQYLKYRYEDTLSNENQEEMVRINDAYEKFFHFFQSDLGHYFRHLYHIVKFIDISDVQDKKQYTNLIRAQLSSYELTLLFYNCLSQYGRDKFKPLIEKHQLLHNMNKEELLSTEHIELYSISAYGSN